MTSAISYTSFSLFSRNRKDKEVIPVTVQLLEDGDEIIRGWAVIVLLRLAKEDEELKKEIETISFPKNAVQGAVGRGYQLPEWLIIK